MSDNTTAAGEVIEGELVPVTSRAGMIHADTDNWMAVYDGDVKTLSTDLCKTDFVPKGFRGNPPAVLAAIMYGREVGLPPIAALQGLYSVDGRVGTYAETQRALVLAAGHEYRIVEQSASRCVIEGRRAGQDEWQRFSFTMQEARDAGLDKKDNWRKWAADMLLARATARMCKAMFPDAVHGMSTAEEIQDTVTVEQVDTSTGEVHQVSEAKPRTVRRRRAPQPKGPEPERQHAPLPKPRGAENSPEGEEPQSGLEDGPGAGGEAPAGETGGEPALVEAGEPKADPGRVAAIAQHFGRLGVTGRDERLMWTGLIAGIPQLASSKDLTRREAAAVEKVLGKLRDRQALEAWGAAHDQRAGERP